MTDGERWAADELTALRETRFTPPAITTFLLASFRRAAASRAERRPLVRQSRRWIIAGTLGTLAVRDTASRLDKPAPSRSLLLGWLALEALMIHWHLGMLESPSGERRDSLSAADALTLTRAAIAPLAAAAPPDRAWFILLLGLAGATDMCDGQLARRRGATRFGRDFDSLSDLAFRAAAIRGARREHWIDRTAHRALTARQVLFAGRAIWHWFARSQRPPSDPQPLTRWHVPMLLGGLTASALGNTQTGSRLLTASAIVGSIGLVYGRPASPAPPIPQARRTTPEGASKARPPIQRTVEAIVRV